MAESLVCAYDTNRIGHRHGGGKLSLLAEGIAPFIPMKIENSTCEIASAALGTLFLCCVHVVYQNTRVLLLLVFCYSYAT